MLNNVPEQAKANQLKQRSNNLRPLSGDVKQDLHRNPPADTDYQSLMNAFFFDQRNRHV